MLNEVLKSLEAQKSFSRAGRLMEGRGAARNVSSFNQKAPPQPIDMSKVLSVAEVDNGGRASGADAMCSSARDHPSVALKSAYVTISEKRNLFDSSLNAYVRTPGAGADARTPNRGGVGSHTPSARPESPHNAVDLSAVTCGPTLRASSPTRSDHAERNLSPVNTRRDAHNSSAFLAIPRAKAQPTHTNAQNPPVGHYNPRFTAVEPVVYNCILPKQIRSKKHLHGRGAMTPEPTQSSSPSAADGRPSSAMESPTSVSASPLTGKAAPNGPSPQPTWPFKSRTIGHHDARAPSPVFALATTSPSVYNETLVTKRQPVTCNMGKEKGRSEPARGISVDLMYNPPIQHQIKVASIKLERMSGRSNEKVLPRTAADVERGQSRLSTENYAKFKYAKPSVIADFDKYPSKDVWTNSSIAVKLSQNTSRSELPANAGASMLETMDRTREVSFKKMLPRKAERQSEGYGLSYDPSYEGLASNKHQPTVHLEKMPERKLNAAPLSEAQQVMYHTEVDKFKKKLTQSVRFDSFPDREARAKTGRAGPTVFHETQTAKDLQFDALALPPTMRPVLKGDPHMSTHASRAKRERALNPPTDTHDLMYSYNVDDFQAPLRKGAVSFDQMVSREKHCGTTFANSIKEMVRK